MLYDNSKPSSPLITWREKWDSKTLWARRKFGGYSTRKVGRGRVTDSILGRRTNGEVTRIRDTLYFWYIYTLLDPKARERTIQAPTNSSATRKSFQALSYTSYTMSYNFPSISQFFAVLYRISPRMSPLAHIVIYPGGVNIFHGSPKISWKDGDSKLKICYSLAEGGLWSTPFNRKIFYVPERSTHEA